MKKILLFCITLFAAVGVQGGVSYKTMTFSTAASEKSIALDNLEMTLSGSNLVITNGADNLSFALTDLQKMYFSDAETTKDVVADTTVLVTFSGTTASVTIADNIAGYVTATVNGAHVILVQSAAAAETTSGEITYILTGSSSNGSFTLEGSYKATVSLQALTLTNPSGPALNIQNGKRIKVSSKSGTTNTLTDGANGDWKGAYYCKGHTEFQGKGTLNVYGNTAHAIYSKEYIEQKNCTINVLSALKDGVHCQQYFSMSSGELNIKGFLTDGIEVGIKDTTLVNDAEDTGNFIQTGGDITIWMAGATGESVKLEGSMNRTGGTLTIIDATAVENVETDFNRAVEVYSLMGMKVASGMLNDLSAQLPQGIYIVRQGTNVSKILVR